MERLLGSLKEEHPQDGDEASVPSIDTSSSIMTIEADFLEGLTSSQSIDSTMERISATICQLSETAKVRAAGLSTRTGVGIAPQPSSSSLADVGVKLI